MYNNIPLRDFYCTEIPISTNNFTDADFMNQANTIMNESVFALLRASDCTYESLYLRRGFGFIVPKDYLESSVNFNFILFFIIL
jgi:hypothetical protein